MLSLQRGKQHGRLAVSRWHRCFTHGLVLGVVVIGLWAPVARANSLDQQLRQDFSRYELTPNGRALAGLRTLKSAVARVKPGMKRRKLRFIRAVAASDLWLLATLLDKRSFYDDIAKAYGTPVGQTVAAIERDLERVAVDYYAKPARDALRALSWINATTRPQLEAMWQRQDVGHRAKALRFLTTLRSLEKAERPTPLARALGSDPCASPKTCKAQWSPWTADGRRALATLDELNTTLRGWRQRRGTGDPFVDALSQGLSAWQERVGALRLRPTLAPPDSLIVPVQARASAEGTAAGGSAESANRGTAELPAPLIVVVDGDAIALRTNHPVRLTPKGEPVFVKGRLAAKRLVIPKDLPPNLNPVAGWVETLRDAAKVWQADRAAIAMTSKAEGHNVVRAALSLRQAGLAISALTGRNTRGQWLSVPIEGLSERLDEAEERRINAMIRLGGYTVERGARKVSIPRQRRDGDWYFDLEGLQDELRRFSGRSLSLTFMPAIAPQVLLETALAMGKPLVPLRVLVP